ncbi:ARM repeat-containing protein [Xylaria intraflava]|nr:ARM repeat-containing protein [Xylaria intraflava]
MLPASTKMDSGILGFVVLLAGGMIALYLLLHRPPARPRMLPTPEDDARKPPPEPKGVRLCQVYPSPESEIVTDIDVIAIHGLDTNSPHTWTWKRQGSNQGVNWLADPEMLPQRIPTARIFTCDWPADRFERPDLVQKTIAEFARLVLAGIKSRPPATNGDPEKDNRPIVFIASCLGGVILMKALTMADGEYLTVGRATRGIVFLATPFRGTSFQDIAKWAEPGLRAWAVVQSKKVSNLMQNVKSTFELGELVREFASFCQKNGLNDNVSTFYETGMTSLPGRVVPWLPAFWSVKKPLVNQQSATLDFVQHPLPLDRPHSKMNKFMDQKDAGYISVADTIENLLRKVRQGQPIEIANKWIHDKRYSRKNVAIERLSGDQLPMDRCYVNLAIIRQSTDGDGLPNEKVTSPSPFSLSSRLKIEIPHKGAEITLQTLFEPRETARGQIRPSRVLIRGRAGVGKTTLCKKIVYEFTNGTLWRDRFDYVLWVPLRNLKLEVRTRIAGYNFKDLFYHEYFSHHREGDKLANALWHVLHETRGSKILFILDGLDEVLHDLHGDMFSFLEEILNQPNVIITSRPNATFSARLERIDMELETIGFYSDQVEAYIKNAFTDLETSEPDLKIIEEVQSFLRRYRLIQGLMRIPIMLDAFCYIWNESISKYSRGEDIQETMTGVYERIEQSLWRKDAEKLDILTRSQIQDAHDEEVTMSTEDEHYLLEVIAFTGMYNDVIDFEPKHRAAISKRYNRPNKKFLLDNMLGRISFLRSSDLSAKMSHRNYHFLHLTFQEYFAARYFVRQWTHQQPLEYLVLGDGRSGSVEPAAFLGRYKYNGRYDIFWRFVTGLLGIEEKIRFFQAIEEEPRDILGSKHQHLVIHCLREVTTDFPLRMNLEDQLVQWILFECQTSYFSYLAHDADIPAGVLVRALEEVFKLSSTETQSRLMETLAKVYPPRTLPKELVQIAAAHLEDASIEVKSGALRMLKGQLVTRGQLHAIATCLQDGNKYVRHTTLITLKEQPLSEEQINAIAACLKDEDRLVREAAIQALEVQQVLTPKQLNAISACLEDEAADVRKAAIQALKVQQVLTRKQLQAVAACIGKTDELPSTRKEAMKILGGQPLTEEQLSAVASSLGDEASDTLKAALETLRGRTVTGEQLRAMITGSEHLDLSALPEDLRWVFVEDIIQEDQSNEESAVELVLSEELLRASVRQLEHQDKAVQTKAANKLISQSTLPKGVLQDLILYLSHPSFKVGVMATSVLTRHSLDMSLDFLRAIGTHVKSENDIIRWTAASVLCNGQAVLPVDILQTLMPHLEDTSVPVRQRVAMTIVIQRALYLVPEQHIKFFYEALLCESAGSTDISWHVIRGTSYFTRGSEEYSEGWPDRFTDAIRKAQEELGVPLCPRMCIES